MNALSNLLTTPIQDEDITHDLRMVMEDHIGLISSERLYTVVDISNEPTEKYIGDFYGLLADLNIPTEVWYPILRLNGLYSPLDYNPQHTNYTIKTIDAYKYNEIKNLHYTRWR